MADSKVVVIGIDGAPFDNIKKWSEEGKLPNLKKLIENGVFGPLESAFFPTSPVAWTSILTGTNSGKHNIFDWAYRENGSYRIETVNSTLIRTPLVWDILNKKGKSAGVFNVPITYPPVPINGFLVSGFDTPNTDVCFTYPEGLGSDIKKHIKDYLLSSQESYLPGRERLFVDDLKRIIDMKKRTVLYLLENYDLDYYIFVFMELDHLHHKMWKFIDQKDKMGYVYEVYQFMDAAVGDIIKKFPQDTTFFVVSDHGAGTLEGIMYINKWLLQLGLLNVKKGPGIILKSFFEKTDLISIAYNLFSKMGMGKLLRSLPKSIQGKAATSFLSFDDINWKKTKCYSFGEYGQIYVNLKGREPQGIVSPGIEYERLIAYVISQLRLLKDPLTGERIVTKIKLREEVFSGPHLKSAPDILFEIKGLSYDSSVKFGFKKQGIFDKPEFSDSGTHRRAGIIIAKGANIRQASAVKEATILDVTPTILHLMGIGIPREIDGKVLESIFNDEFLKDNPPKFTSEQFLRRPPVGKQRSEQEEEEVRSRLKSLGYMG